MATLMNTTPNPSPPLAAPSKSRFTDEQALTIAKFMMKLEGLRIKAKIVDVVEGPVITGYYFKPDYSTNVAKLTKLTEDFASAAEVEKVSIFREKGNIVIYVPNRERKVIDFKDALYWMFSSDTVSQLRLPILLGVDSVGHKKAIDLSEQPHILIAGQTGSGKSVFQSAIIASLCCLKTPDELELILVDTKKLDLPLFEKLPHVLQVCTERKEFVEMVESLLKQTRLRLEMLSQEKCRNIGELNARREPDARWPYKILIIDELADLLDQDKMWRTENPKDAAETPTVPAYLKSLAQIARAAGVHIITGTQRSSVKVVSNDIKANLPCRIALKLPSRDDSKTILGGSGAETLLGRGDMLVQHEGSEVLHRYHGPFVKQEDIVEIVKNSEHIRNMFRKE
jgi:DNA segregation ATPase FtsK/SpoIIIE, S-DNA-T family